MRLEKIRVAVVGLEFGNTFMPAFVAHPNVELVGVCDTNPVTLSEVGDRYNIPAKHRHARLEDVLAGSAYHAVALFTPIPDHASHTLSALAAGKHVACAVPMAVDLEDMQRIIDARRKANRVYMMMETSLYTPELLMLLDMHAAGEFGRLQFLRGVWYNNLENHPRYWHGLPPMHYITHPLSPILKLAGCRVEKVCCLGSGTMREELCGVYNNRFPIETAIFSLVPHAGSTAPKTPLACEITSIVIETALQNKETFDFYGSKQSFTWSTFWGDKHALVRHQKVWPGGPKSTRSVVLHFDAPSAHERLPRQLWHVQPRAPQPHLVHEFVTAILENRPSAIDVAEAARYSAPGLCAHQSAEQGGTPVPVPELG